MEFAAEGSTADPYLVFRAAKRTAKTETVADIPGGPGGVCRWPAQACCTITDIEEVALLSTAFEVPGGSAVYVSWFWHTIDTL